MLSCSFTRIWYNSIIKWCARSNSHPWHDHTVSKFVCKLDHSNALGLISTTEQIIMRSIGRWTWCTFFNLKKCPCCLQKNVHNFRHPFEYGDFSSWISCALICILVLTCVDPQYSYPNLYWLLKCPSLELSFDPFSDFVLANVEEVHHMKALFFGLAIMPSWLNRSTINICALKLGLNHKHKTNAQTSFFPRKLFQSDCML